MTGLYSSLHFGVLHYPKIVKGGYRINPVELSGSGEAFGHIFVGAETKKTYQFALLCTFGPLFYFICETFGIGQAVKGVVQIDVFGVHSFQGGLKTFFDFLCGNRPPKKRRLAYNEQFLSGVRVLREVFTNAKLSVSTSIIVGCVPVSYTGLESFS